MAWQVSPSAEAEANTVAMPAASRPQASSAAAPTLSAIFTAMPLLRRSFGGSRAGAGTTVGAAR